MEGDLSELAHHASEARLTASAMRAQLSALRTGGGVFSPATERPLPYSGEGGGTSRSSRGSAGGGVREESPPAARLFMFTPARALGVGRDQNDSSGGSFEQQAPEVCRPSSSSRRRSGQSQVTMPLSHTAAVLLP